MSANESSSSSQVGLSTVGSFNAMDELMLLRSHHKQNLTFHSINDTDYDKSISNIHE